MTKNKVYLICLITGFLLISSVLVAQGAGFFSYEDGDKFVLWANVRVVDSGIKFSNLGSDETEDVSAGNIKIDDKEFFIRGFMAFNCINYPSQISCATTFGDIGGRTFLITENLGGDTADLVLESENLGINLQGDTINLDGDLILTDNKNLIVSEVLPLGGLPSNSVVANTLNVKEISNNNGNKLYIDNIELKEGAIFKPQSVLSINLLEF